MGKPKLLKERASGILLHPTSLPTGYGVGDLGPGAHSFAETLRAAGQRWWQMLPLAPVGAGNSPYHARSSFALEPLLISPELLYRQGLLSRSNRDGCRVAASNRVNFERTRKRKNGILRKAFEKFEIRRDSGADTELAQFEESNSDWLPDYSLFETIRNRIGRQPWTDWPTELRTRRSASIRKVEQDSERDLRYHVFVQFQLERQWRELAAHCRSLEIKLLGDLPFFVAPDSADVWANQELFELKRGGRPDRVAGVPPDYFSRTGQLWGNPLYDWKVHRANNFRWWIRRLAQSLDRFDAIRLDHFIGFVRHWSVSGRAKTARKGKWTRAPGRALLQAVLEALGEIPMIAEDLGIVTREVKALRDDYGFPGMRILQFGFEKNFGGSGHLPENYLERCVAYTGTHDNDTLVGWLSSLSRTESSSGPKNTRRQLRVVEARYGEKLGEIPHQIIRDLFSSRANLVILPLQDVLLLGSTARMNLPGTADGNWEWRAPKGMIRQEQVTELRQLTVETGRTRG